MKITIDLTAEQLAMVDKMVAYYREHFPKKDSTRENIIKACVMKVWYDWKGDVR